MPELGKRLREIRLIKGLSAKELSLRSGVARSLISQLETGKRHSTGIDTISRIALALEVSPSIFLKTETTQKGSPSYKHSLNILNSEDISSYMAKESSEPYLRLAQKAEQAGLSPDLLEELLDVIIKYRSNPRLPKKQTDK